MNKIRADDDWNENYSYTYHTSGFASTLPYEEALDIVQRLHQVVEEVTGIPVQQAVKPKLGFL